IGKFGPQSAEYKIEGRTFILHYIIDPALGSQARAVANYCVKYFGRTLQELSPEDRLAAMRRYSRDKPFVIARLTSARQAVVLPRGVGFMGIRPEALSGEPGPGAWLLYFRRTLSPEQASY